MAPNQLKNPITLDELKSLDLVSYLGELNILPKKISGNDYWYCSPFREEKSPSFKVNRRKNIWVDFGEYKQNNKFSGGSIVDLGTRLYGCGIYEFRMLFSKNVARPIQKHRNIKVLPAESENQNHILSAQAITAQPLLTYLESRNIDLDIARKFLKEVRYESKGSVYYALGFKNDLGGFELRNKHIKSSTAPKGITTFHNSSSNKEVLVFEGVFDYLTFMSIHRDKDLSSKNYVVLNSAVFFSSAREYLEKTEVLTANYPLDLNTEDPIKHGRAT